MNSKAINLPTSLLIPNTSPFATPKFLSAILDIKNPEIIAPKSPINPTTPPNKNAITATIIVDNA